MSSASRTTRSNASSLSVGTSNSADVRVERRGREHVGDRLAAPLLARADAAALVAEPRGGEPVDRADRGRVELGERALRRSSGAAASPERRERLEVVVGARRRAAGQPSRTAASRSRMRARSSAAAATV